MATNERPLDRAQRTGPRIIRFVGDELRTARLDSGLSQNAVGRACSMSHSEIARLEAGTLRRIDPVKVCCFAETVGLEASVRFFPAGDPLRDAGQRALLDRLRRLGHPSLVWRTEVGLPIAGDRRAWDATVSGPDWTRPVEAESRLTDGQALARRVFLKQRDGNAEFVIIVAADTRHNRAVADAIRAALGQPSQHLPP